MTNKPSEPSVSPAPGTRMFSIQRERGAKAHPLRISWSLAEKAYSVYSARYGTDQSLERLNERGGFGPSEMDDYLPTWREEADEIASLQAEIERLRAPSRATPVSQQPPDGWEPVMGPHGPTTEWRDGEERDISHVWEGDLSIEHPNRCKLRDRLLWADIFNDDGSHRASWRCHKREGHDGPCSSHNDCGVTNGGVVCGLLPGHEGPHEWETRIRLAPSRATPEEEGGQTTLGQAIHELRALVKTEAGHIAYFDDHIDAVVAAALRKGAASRATSAPQEPQP